MDDTIVFHSLEEKHIRQIVTLMVKQLQDRLVDNEIHFTLSDQAIDKIADEGMDLEYGARPLRRSLQKNVEDFLSEELLKGDLEKGQSVEIDVDDNGDFYVSAKKAFEDVK